MGCSDPQVADLAPSRCLLHRCLGPLTRRPHILQQDTYLASSRLRRRPWCAKMVSDVVGHVVACSLHPMGRSCWTIPRHLALAVARCPRRCTRRRTGYDLIAGKPELLCLPLSCLSRMSDLVSIACMCNIGLRSNHRFRLCDGCSRNCAQQGRTGERLP